MSYLFVGYPKCTTSQKAEKWLRSNGIAYEFRNIKEQNPSASELKAWHGQSALPLGRFFNTSGLLYRSMSLKEKLPGMGESERLALLASDGMLVRRPILVGDGLTLVGFKEDEWEKRLKKG